MEARAGGTWLMRHNPATGTPRSLVGSGIQLTDWRENTLAEARRHANQVLENYGDLLGTRGASTFREVIGQRMGSCWTFTFHQFFAGLPVIGGRADVRIHSTGAVSMLGSTAWGIPADFEVKPRITIELATAAAWLALGEKPVGAPARNLVRQPRLVIWGDVAAPQRQDCHLAWEVPVVNLDASFEGSAGRYYVDAITGRVLRFVNELHRCSTPGCSGLHAVRGAAWREAADLRRDHTSGATLAKPAASPIATPASPAAVPVPTTVTVMAWTRTGLTAVVAPTNEPVAGLEVDVPGIGVQTTDANGQFSIDIAAPTTIAINWLDGVHCAPITGPSAPSAQVTVQPGVPATLQLLSSSATANELAHTSTYYWVHEANEWLRSLVGNVPEMSVIDGVTSTVNIPISCNANMFGLNISFRAAGGNCNNTAFSTVIVHEWGHVLDFLYGGIDNSWGNGLGEAWADTLGMYRADDPHMGLGFFANGNFVRTGLNGQQFTSLTLAIGEHQSGQSFMGMAWKLRENLRANLGTAQAIAISDNIVITTIAADAKNQPDAVLEIQLADDDNANLLDGSPHYAEIRAACEAHSLPYQGITVPGAAITHAPLGDKAEPGVPQRVTMTATAPSGTFTEVRLVLSAASQRVMLPTGNPDEYHALVPGATRGTTTSYHFEALHSSGGVVRDPAFGRYTFGVFDSTVVYAEDFESGASGWASAMVNAEDDWQLGTPVGVVGSGWSDPVGASSGTNAYGNDLGLVTATLIGDGAYSPWAENVLRSPSIDCSNQTGMRLRFQRWLTVDAATADHAWIEVNGTTVWSNSASIVDSAWLPIDIPIPMADNNPSVQVSWHLDADFGTEAGGWTIDDVELVATNFLPNPPIRLSFSPDQVAVNASMTLLVLGQGQGAIPFVVALGTTPGPTIVPGLPPILVGGNPVVMPGVTSSFGLFTQTTTAPPTTSAFGTLWYSQAVALDASSNLVISNPYINLITP